ncbi:MAG: hypothetical protein WC554_04075 [Clostridia bacterium]|jgi:hypothetical protein
MAEVKTCMTQDVKDLLVNFIDKQPKEFLRAFVDGITICPAVATAAAASVAKAVSTRQMAQPWNVKAIYFDESGRQTVFDSPSQAVKSLVGKVSGTVCDPTGVSCHVSDLAETLQVKGFIVTDQSGDQARKASQGGTEMRIYNPKSPIRPVLRLT